MTFPTSGSRKNQGAGLSPMSLPLAGLFVFDTGLLAPEMWLAALPPAFRAAGIETGPHRATENTNWIRHVSAQYPLRACYGSLAPSVKPSALTIAQDQMSDLASSPATLLLMTVLGRPGLLAKDLPPQGLCTSCSLFL